ncbi:hypothetical protein ERJ75_000600400 [Trypanosoma vivax]|nr:hypothetical protein ERJ75_000600400 [Trypanosoma vivax]
MHEAAEAEKAAAAQPAVLLVYLTPGHQQRTTRLPPPRTQATGQSIRRDNGRTRKAETRAPSLAVRKAALRRWRCDVPKHALRTAPHILSAVADRSAAARFAPTKPPPQRPQTWERHTDLTRSKCRRPVEHAQREAKQQETGQGARLTVGDHEKRNVSPAGMAAGH